MPKFTRIDSAGRTSTATFTPAANSHDAGDSIGVAAEFTHMGVAGSNVLITSGSILVAGGTAEASAFRLYLFNVTPPSALADDGAFLLASGDRASFLGYVDLGTPVDLGSSLYVQTDSLNHQVKLLTTSLWGYLVNLTTVTPAAVARTVTLSTVPI